MCSRLNTVRSVPGWGTRLKAALHLIANDVAAGAEALISEFGVGLTHSLNLAARSLARLQRVVAA